MAEKSVPDKGAKDKSLTSNTVIRILRDSDFRFQKNWRNVSRDLDATLDERDKLGSRITREAIDASDALEDCVDNWLRNSDDPNWDKLIVIIAKVDKRAARYMRSYIGFPPVKEELSVLESLTDSELEELGELPLDLMSKLVAEGVVPDQMKDVSTWKEVIDRLKHDLKEDRKRELVFGKLMLHHKRTVLIGRRIIKEEPPTPVYLPRTYGTKFEELVGEYNIFLDTIRSKIQPNLPPLQDFVHFVKRFHDVKTQVVSCSDYDSVFEILEESCSYINITKIEKIAKRYKCTEALEDIREYKSTFKTFCSEIREGLMPRLPLCLSYKKEPLLCERLEIVMKWEPSMTTLEDIEAVLEIALEDIAQEVLIVSVGGGSVVVVCYIPHSLVFVAVFNARKNLASLIKQDLVSLTIGYFPVLEKKTDKEVVEEEEEQLHAVEEETAEKEQISKEAKLLDTPQEETKSEHVVSKELEELQTQLQKKDEEYMQQKEECEQWKSIAQSSSGDEMTSQLIERLKAYEDKLQLLKEEKVKMAEKEKVLQAELLTAKSEVQQISEKFTAQSDQLKATVEHNEREHEELKGQIMEKDITIDELTSQNKEVISVKDAYKKMASVARQDKERVSRENETLVQKMKSCAPTLHDDWKDPHAPPVQIVMTSFSDYKKSNENWYSPCFFSHEGGYKMCLRIKANGADSGQGTHVSVYVHLMAGENDEYLPWPFKGVVKLEVLNRRSNRNHFTNEIKFDDTTNQDARQRVFNGIATKSGTMAFMGQGGVQFMSQDKLPYNAQEGTEYLRDDSIKIRVTSIEVQPVVPIPSVPKTDVESVAEFKITDFSKNKSSNAECISEPFYSHEKGYKFALLVYPNGRGSYKERSVSAFVHLMKGENDNRLKFPFRGEILTQIVNTREDKNHVEKMISFDDETDPDGKYGARVAGITTWFSSGRSFQGYGFLDFLSHDLLMFDENRDNTQYLSDDDSLTVRVMKIKVNSL